MIIAKRHFVKFYLAVLSYMIFFLIMALLVWGLREQASSKIGYIVMILMGTACGFLFFYTPYVYYKKSPLITVDDYSISFNDEVYFWKDLNNIKMTGKKYFGFLSNSNKEATSMIFSGNKEKYFFDDMYENSPKIKTFIQITIIDKQEHVLNPAINTSYSNNLASDLRFDSNSASDVISVDQHKFKTDPLFEVQVPNIISKHITYYNGFQLFCIEGIVLWILFILFLAVSLFTFSQSKTGVSLGFCILTVI